MITFQFPLGKKQLKFFLWSIWIDVNLWQWEEGPFVKGESYKTNRKFQATYEIDWIKSRFEILTLEKAIVWEGQKNNVTLNFVNTDRS